jgi:hypothetical protein
LNPGDGSAASAAATITGTPAGMTYAGPGFHGDFDGDGTGDLIASGKQGTAFVEMRFLRGNGGGGFADAGAAAAPGVDFNQGQCVFCVAPFPDQPRTGFVADLDTDGDLDLATVMPIDYAPGDTKAWRNHGSGTFDALGTLGGQCLRAVDYFDGDGVLDLWVVRNSDQGWVKGLAGGGFGA